MRRSRPSTRAGLLVQRAGLVDEAVRHFLAAGDPIAAAALVEIQVHPTLDRENWRQLEHLIGLLPAAVSGRPRLLLAQAWLHFFRWQFAAIEARLDAAESALQADPLADQQAAMEVVLRGEISLLRVPGEQSWMAC